MTSNCSSSDEQGFTLIELVIVLAILPLIMGAAATAVIVSLNNSSSTAKRLADSESAQVTNAYFGADVEGASLVTTNQTLPTGAPSAASPQYCPSSAPVTGAISLVQFYRSSPVLSDGYWLTGSGQSARIVRYSCSVVSGTTTLRSTLPVADVPITPTSANSVLTGSATVSPKQFGIPAATAWIPTVAATLITSVTTPSGNKLSSITGFTVESTTGFAASQAILVNTTLGPETTTCATVSATTLSSCSSSGTGYVEDFYSGMTQDSISSVSLSVSEPGSNYTYQALGSPRAGAGIPVPPSPTLGSIPALLTLGPAGIDDSGGGDGGSCGSTNKVNICAQGQAYIDNGSLSCPSGNHNGIASTTPPILQAPSGATSNNCTTSSAPQVSDPVAPTLPQPCFALSSGLTLPTNPSVIPVGSAGAGNAVPGIYTTVLSGVLEPGVYVAEGGTGSLSMVSSNNGSQYWRENSGSTPDPSSGVLIYIPGPGGAYPPTCSTYQPSSGTPPSLSATGSSGTPIGPLDSQQSQYYFSGSTAESDMWLWQDAANSTSPALKGSTVIAASGGLMYMPSASLVSTSGTPSITTGKLIVGGISIKGGGNGLIDLTNT